MPPRNHPIHHERSIQADPEADNDSLSLHDSATSSMKEVLIVDSCSSIDILAVRSERASSPNCVKILTMAADNYSVDDVAKIILSLSLVEDPNQVAHSVQIIHRFLHDAEDLSSLEKLRNIGCHTVMCVVLTRHMGDMIIQRFGLAILDHIYLCKLEDASALHKVGVVRVTLGSMWAHTNDHEVQLLGLGFLERLYFNCTPGEVEDSHDFLEHDGPKVLASALYKFYDRADTLERGFALIQHLCASPAMRLKLIEAGVMMQVARTFQTFGSDEKKITGLARCAIASLMDAGLYDLPQYYRLKEAAYHETVEERASYNMSVARSRP